VLRDLEEEERMRQEECGTAVKLLVMFSGDGYGLLIIHLLEYTYQHLYLFLWILFP
jgi:hypothetical protein